MANLLSAALVAAGLVSAQAPDSGAIVVNIGSLRSTQGQVLVSLYNRPDGFPRDRDVILQRRIVDTIDGDHVTVRFGKLPFGEYAIAMMHDENRSGGMDRGFLGVPKEGYGFSNNLKPKFSAPSFEKAKFLLSEQEVQLSLEMIYR
jgi:uncharacterized protein (DUF2141 family)